MAKTGYSYGALVDHVNNHVADTSNPHGVTATQAKAVSTEAIGTQIMAENLQINKAGVSGLSLETDSNGIAIRNLAVPGSGYRSVGIHDSGELVVYSNNLGFKDIMHEGNTSITAGESVYTSGNLIGGLTISARVATTRQRGVSQLSSSLTSSTDQLAATPLAVKTVNDNKMERYITAPANSSASGLRQSNVYHTDTTITGLPVTGTYGVLVVTGTPGDIGHQMWYRHGVNEVWSRQWYSATTFTGWVKMLSAENLKNPTRTALTGGHSSGNFVLSDSWGNYDALMVHGTNDGKDKHETEIITYDELAYRQSQGTNFSLFTIGGAYWSGRFASDGRTFRTLYENNARIAAIWGLKY